MDARSCLRHPKQYPLSDYPSTLHDKRPLHTRFELVLAFREGSAIKILCQELIPYPSCILKDESFALAILAFSR